MVTTDPKDLGQLIFDENPYIKASPTPKTLKIIIDETETSYRDMQWYFKNGSNYVAKALRIPYRYTDKDGRDIVEYLLIGFEGSGGD